jgi:hypothetical protein
MREIPRTKNPIKDIVPVDMFRTKSYRSDENQQKIVGCEEWRLAVRRGPLLMNSSETPGGSDASNVHTQRLRGE